MIVCDSVARLYMPELLYFLISANQLAEKILLDSTFARDSRRLSDCRNFCYPRQRRVFGIPTSGRKAGIAIELRAKGSQSQFATQVPTQYSDRSQAFRDAGLFRPIEVPHCSRQDT